MRGVFVTVNQSLEGELVKDVARQFGADANIITVEEQLENEAIEGFLEDTTAQPSLVDGGNKTIAKLRSFRGPGVGCSLEPPRRGGDTQEAECSGAAGELVSNFRKFAGRQRDTGTSCSPCSNLSQRAIRVCRFSATPRADKVCEMSSNMVRSSIGSPASAPAAVEGAGSLPAGIAAIFSSAASRVARLNGFER